MSLAGQVGLVVLVVGVIAMVLTAWVQWLIGEPEEIKLSKTSERKVRR